VFGYGSLVSPTSLASTIARDVTVGVDVLEAELRGWGRRWNYGVSLPCSFELDGRRVDGGTVVALGLVRSQHETVNGIVVLVDGLEVERLDRRERDYDRVDVTDEVAIAGSHTLPDGRPIVTYVPRPTAIARYEAARADGTAGVRRTYWELVDGAFAALGADRRATFHATTPAPDVPLVDVVAADVVVPDPPARVR
jgi:dephospho-CoA kinase